MLGFLKDHPFGVEAFFESSLVLTYAASKESVGRFIPDCLELDLFDDKWAFVAAAMVQTKHLRPKGFPRFLGSDFFLIGYRVFVRFTDDKGKRSRGLYILGSATNRRRMEFFGNIFTHYNYTTTDITQTQHDGIVDVNSMTSAFHVSYLEPGSANVPLPELSPFADWKEARRFAGPLPFTYTHEPGSDKVLVIEGVRQNWTPAPVQVIDHEFSFINDLGVDDLPCGLESPEERGHAEAEAEAQHRFLGEQQDPADGRQAVDVDGGLQGEGEQAHREEDGIAHQRRHRVGRKHRQQQEGDGDACRRQAQQQRQVAHRRDARERLHQRATMVWKLLITRSV